MEMLEQLENLDALIVVDCVRHGQAPGTPVLLKDDDVPVFFKTKLSPHGGAFRRPRQPRIHRPGAPAHGHHRHSAGVDGTGHGADPTVAERLPQLLAMTVAELHGLGIDVRGRA